MDDDIFERSMAELGVEPLDAESKGGRRGRGDLEESDSRLFEQAMRELDGAGLPPAARGKDSARRGDRHPAVRRLKPREKDPRIGDQLDLHGMKGDEALRRLESFVAEAAGSGTRAVLVITGKGHHSAGGRGVLRRRVEEWIQGPGRRRVRAYSPAPRRLGGRGAWVLRLR